ncbi:MAG: RNA-binding protein [Desulfobulbaceae bacterium]|nr:MAG: RNA-binding protein [Desulfobulbaceae bacterium]
MAKKLYVGNLPYTVDNNQLRSLFEQYGEVLSATIVTDRDSGRSKGFGFVEMSSDEAGAEAISKLNGFTFERRALTVNEARPREERPRTNRPPRNDRYEGGGGGGGGGRRGNNRRDDWY